MRALCAPSNHAPVHGRADAARRRLAIRPSPMATPASIGEIALGATERHVGARRVAPLGDDAAALEDRARRTAAFAHGARDLAPRPRLVPLDDADVAAIRIVERSAATGSPRLRQRQSRPAASADRDRRRVARSPPMQRRRQAGCRSSRAKYRSARRVSVGQAAWAAGLSCSQASASGPGGDSSRNCCTVRRSRIRLRSISMVCVPPLSMASRVHGADVSRGNIVCAI